MTEKMSILNKRPFYACAIIVATMLMALLSIYIYISNKPREVDINTTSIKYSETSYAFGDIKEEYEISKDQSSYKYYFNNKLEKEKYIQLTELEYKNVLEFIINKQKIYSMTDKDHKGNDGTYFIIEVINGKENKKVTEYMEKSNRMNNISTKIYELFN